MDIKEIVYLSILGAIALFGIIGVIIALVRGELKKFIIEKMEEAEELYKNLPKPEKSKAKLKYVLECVNEKYSISKTFLNVKKFIEKIIDIANSLQNKGKEN